VTAIVPPARLKKLDDLDLDVVEELCRSAAEPVAAGRFAT
jgi:hypothetical protein